MSDVTDESPPSSAVPAGFVALDADATAVLTAWQAPGPTQQDQRRRILEHLAGTEGATWRRSGPVHLTASVLVLSPDHESVLLALHKKARLWLQMGGHLEAADSTVLAAAAREGREESGLDGLRLLPGLVDVDCHRLGGGFSTCREHLDLRFAAVAEPGSDARLSAESADLRWFPADELPPGTGTDVPRLVAAAGRAARSPGAH